MRRTAHRLVVVMLALAALGGLGCSGPGKPPGGGGALAGAPEGKLKLVVLIVVDQLPTWAFERDRGLYKGGFARLLREGGYVRNAEIPYATPFTAPGHATIGTGAPPSVHGVVGNTWYRRGEGKERPAEFDPAAKPFVVGESQAGEIEEEDSASSRALKVEGVADTLRRATGGRARSVAIGLKPRGSVFMAGQRPELAVWYEPAAGGMTTSHAYAREAPRWLVELAKNKPATRFFKQTWEPLDAEVLARATGIPDDAPGEGSQHGLGTTFPHAMAETSPARAILHTPYADELVMEAALAAIPALELGKDDVPDLLAISFNAHDYAGHLWGPGSWEVLDLKLRLDAALGRLFDTLDARLGKGRWGVVLTSDHGATPVVEQSKVAGARRVPPDEIARAVEGMLQPALGTGPWVAKIASGNVYLVPAFAKLPAALKEQAIAAVVEGAGRVAGIEIAYRNDHAAGRCAGRADLERAVCYSIVPGESGELTVLPHAGSLITTYESGSHHDAPFDDNRRVPILVMAPGIARHAGEGSLLQVAPTVAALLGIPAPAEAIAPPLFGLPAVRAR